MDSLALNKINIITDSTEQPISLSEAKDWLRVTTSDDDNKISMIILSSIQDIEQYIRHPLITKTIEYITSGLLYSEDNKRYFLRTPYNLTTLNSVKIVDNFDIENTLTSTEYDLFGNTLYLDNSYSPRKDHSYIINFNAGIAVNALTTPQNIKISLLNLVKLYYDGECSGMDKNKILTSLNSYIHLDYLGL